MYPLQRRATLLVKALLILTLFIIPLAGVNLSARAAPTAQQKQPGAQNDNIVVLKSVQNSDGTTDVTLRIYAAPNDPNAPDGTYSVSQDTYIAYGNPNGNYGASSTSAIGYSNTGPLAMRMLLQFNLSSIPSNATVNSATIYVYQYASSPANDYPMGFQAQYAVTSWNQYNATWNNANYIGGATLPVGNFPSTLGWLAVNSTNLIKTWVSGQQPNYGLILTGDEGPSRNRSRYFNSSNAGSNRPYVDINYTVSCNTTPPTSYVNSLPTYSPNAFTVSWTGTAYTTPGCPANGISSYIVWYQVNNGSFIKWLDGVPYTSATFNASSLGIGNGAYVGFRSQAIDNYGNKTPAGNATAATTINAAAPTVTMTPLPTWTNTPSFTVSWTGNTQGGPSISTYDLQVSINGGPWQTLISNTPQTSFQYTNAQDNINYVFHARARNSAGTVGDWSAPTGTTTSLTPPTATLDPLPAWTNSSSFVVSWYGSSQGGPNIEGYDFQASINGGAFQTLLSNTPQTSFQYNNAQNNTNYVFQVRARNIAGLVGNWSPLAGTTVDLTPPTTSMNSLPQYTSSTPFWIVWTGSDATSGVSSYNVQYQVDGGAWQALVNNVPFPTNNYLVQQPVQTGQVWGFRVQAVDSAGNVQAWPGAAQASTRIFLNPIAVVKSFNPAILQSTAPITSSFPVTWTGCTPPGSYITNYTIYYSFNNGPYQTWNTFSGPGSQINPTFCYQSSAVFNWTTTPYTDGVYTFKARANNNVGQTPLDLPQYAQSIIVDMAGKLHVQAHLPLMYSNSQ